MIDVADIAVAGAIISRDARLDAAGDWAADENTAGAVVEPRRIADISLGAEAVRRRWRGDQDRPAGRIAPVERALRPFQDLNVLDIGNVLIGR